MVTTYNRSGCFKFLQSTSVISMAISTFLVAALSFAPLASTSGLDSSDVTCSSTPGSVTTDVEMSTTTESNQTMLFIMVGMLLVIVILLVLACCIYWKQTKEKEEAEKKRSNKADSSTVYKSVQKKDEKKSEAKSGIKSVAPPKSNASAHSTKVAANKTISGPKVSLSGSSTSDNRIKSSIIKTANTVDYKTTRSSDSAPVSSSSAR